MKRRLLSFLCFLLLVFLTIFWVRSQYGGDFLSFGHGAPGMVSPDGSWGRVYRINSRAGSLQWIADDSLPARSPSSLGMHWSGGRIPSFRSPGGIPPFWCGTLTKKVGAVGFQWDVYRGRSVLSSHADLGAVNPVPILARRLTIPYWFLLALTGAGAFPWLGSCWSSHQRFRWQRQGRCGHCGYDLRASPGRCPECGLSEASLG